MKVDKFYDFFTGRCVRKIAFEGAPKNAVYLTFDDGPTTHATPEVLDLLAKYQVKATFFLIGQRAKALPALTQRILDEGHTIGNHTIDHDTKNYFSGRSGMSSWLKSSEDFFEKDLHLSPVGFRSPLGIKTPQLNSYLRKIKRPLTLWNVRFYDTKYGLQHSEVTKKLPTISEGSIILLHDCHVNEKQTEFLSSLEYLIVECKKKNLSFLPLEEELIMNSYLAKYKKF